MRTATRTFRLRRFASSGDPDYPSALSIYVNSVSPESRTSSNEITYWLDRSYAEFGDEFLVFGFYLNRKVIGFAQMAFFRKERLLFIDYMVLHEEYRTLGEYFQFVSMLQHWISDARLEFDYAVAEISFESTTPQPSRKSVLLARLFKQVGFGVVQCRYFYPPLGEHNPQSGMQAHLLIASHPRPDRLKRETLAHIMLTVYFRHYQRWHEPFLASADNYQRILMRLLRGMERQIGDRRDVAVNGLELYCQPGLSKQAAETRRAAPLWTPLFLCFAFVLMCGALFCVQAYTQLEYSVVAVILAGMLVALATSFALMHKESRPVLDTLLGAVARVFGKRK